MFQGGKEKLEAGWTEWNEWNTTMFKGNTKPKEKWEPVNEVSSLWNEKKVVSVSEMGEKEWKSKTQYIAFK